MGQFKQEYSSPRYEFFREDLELQKFWGPQGRSTREDMGLFTNPLESESCTLPYSTKWWSFTVVLLLPPGELKKYDPVQTCNPAAKHILCVSSTYHLHTLTTEVLDKDPGTNMLSPAGSFQTLGPTLATPKYIINSTDPKALNPKT